MNVFALLCTPHALGDAAVSVYMSPSCSHLRVASQACSYEKVTKSKRSAVRDVCFFINILFCLCEESVERLLCDCGVVNV